MAHGYCMVVRDVAQVKVEPQTSVGAILPPRGVRWGYADARRQHMLMRGGDLDLHLRFADTVRPFWKEYLR